MASDPYVRQARGVFSATIGSSAVVAGDLLYFDGVDWELAVASANTTYAEAIALNSYKAGDVGNVCLSGVLVDIDAPYTQGVSYYLSGASAGKLTATRPTTVLYVAQRVGYAISTSELRLEVAAPHEVTVQMDSRGATSAHAVLDSGNFGGFTLDAQNEVALFSCAVPDNAVSIVVVNGWTAAEASAGTPTYDITVGSAVSGAQHDVVTADATLVNQAAEGSAPDEIIKFVMTTGFDATDIMRTGALLGVKFLADDGGTDIRFALNVSVVFLCV